MRREGERRGGPQVGTAKRRCSRRIEREERRNHSRRKACDVTDVFKGEPEAEKGVETIHMS